MSEDKNFQEVLDKANELDSIDFKNTTDFQFQDYYSAIEKIARKNNVIKNEEAEQVIAKQATNFVDESFVEELKRKEESIKDFIRKYDPNSELIKSMVEQDVDKVYALTNYLVNLYIKYVNEMPFNFEFTASEIKFVDKLLVRTLEYNGDDVFNYVEFMENCWMNIMEEFEADKSKEKYVFKIDIKMILILHHLIKGHKVTGHTGEFRLFRNVLYRIAQTNKVFNAYNIIVERIKADLQVWGGALDAALNPNEQVPLQQPPVTVEPQPYKP